MPATPEQSATASNGGSATATLTPTLSSGPAEGNILVACISGQTTINSFNTPAGWTLVHNHEAGQSRCAMFFKVAGASEPSSVVLTWSGNSRAKASFEEFSHADTFVGTLDQSAEDVSNANSSTQTQSTGTTPTTSTADSLAVAFIGVDTQSAWENNSFDNSFVESINFGGVGGQPRIITAYKLSTPIGAVETTATTTDTGNEAVGIVAVFAPNAAVGGQDFPFRKYYMGAA